MDWHIKSHVGIGPIRLGMTREETRRAVGRKVFSYRKTPLDKHKTDAYRDIGVFVYFKDDDICEAIEVSSPINPLFFERPLLAKPYPLVRDWFTAEDSELDIDESGFTSQKFGLGLYAPHGDDEPERPAEGVIVFEPSYYD